MRLLLSFVLAASLFAARGSAQCSVPDGLDPSTAGCSPAFTNVPQRGFVQGSLGICWLDCQVDTTAGYTAVWGALNPVQVPGAVANCGWYQTRLRLFLGVTLAWQGQMRLTYSRTWSEIGPNNVGYQVYRYLVNGDLMPQIAAPGPCATPSCAAPNGNRVRFTGYVDYARNCGSSGGPTQRAWMLTHACDAIDHAPGGPRAGAYHPNRFYSFVGPAAGFVPGLGTGVEAGAGGVDALRRWDAPVLPARCNAEEPILNASIMPNANLCLCGTGPGLWYEGWLSATSAGGSTVGPFPGSDPFRSFPIGAWSNPAVFPGVEEVRWNAGEELFVDCTGVGRQEPYFGVTTHNGYPAFTINASTPPMPLPTMFIDQANSVLLPAGVAIRNVPFRSDHVLNLNL
jgi:hypothetical protein